MIEPSVVTSRCRDPVQEGTHTLGTLAPAGFGAMPARANAPGWNLLPAIQSDAVDAWLRSIVKNADTRTASTRSTLTSVSAVATLLAVLTRDDIGTTATSSAGPTQLASRRPQSKRS